MVLRNSRNRIRRHLTEETLRHLVRNLLREADMSAKPLALVQRLVDVNREIEATGLDVEVGLARIDSSKIQGFFFAVRARGSDGATAKPKAINSASYMRQVDFAQVALVAAGRNRGEEVMEAIGSARDLIADRMPYGRIMIRKTTEKDDGACSGAWTVVITDQTREGWGPLLYDLAVELATELGGGLTADRKIVSPDARGVWGKYDASRPDVDKEQLDIWAGEGPQLTPDDPSDDCNQTSAQDAVGGAGTWSDSSLSRAYRKSGAGVTAALRQAGLLWE